MIYNGLSSPGYSEKASRHYRITGKKKTFFLLKKDLLITRNSFVQLHESISLCNSELIQKNESE